MNTNNLAKIIFIGLEAVTLFGVIALSFTYSGDYVIAALISLLTALAVILQKEQQNIQWEDSTDEIDSQIQMYIDMQQDMGR